jgi:cytidylate kinase
MIITIDGPAGAGKSSVARLLAQRLGYLFLDTGAMYRAVTLAAMSRNVAWDDPDAVARLVDQIDLSLADDRVWLDGQDVTRRIRDADVTNNTRHVANNPAARARLVTWQRRLATDRDVVTEGRDQGTVAFPHAECKFFLTASSRRRAERRFEERRARDDAASLEQILRDQDRRDADDEAREVGRLMPAADAVLVDTDAMNLEQVVEELLRHVRQRAAGSP